LLLQWEILANFCYLIQGIDNEKSKPFSLVAVQDDSHNDGSVHDDSGVCSGGNALRVFGPS